MKNSLFIPVLAACMATGVSCIEEKLNACPPEGGSVEIRLRVEKFQARTPYTPDELEADFGARVHSLCYLLYADGRFIEQGELSDTRAAGADTYVFRHDPLPFGQYRLAFAANTSARALAGKPDAPELCYIPYRDDGSNDDYFRSDLWFEVACPIRNQFDAVLQRVHGVTRFRMENIPADIVAAEVTLDNVGQLMPLCGDPEVTCEVTERIPVADNTRAACSCTLGTFCTPPHVRTSWRLKLYGRDGGAPVYDRVVTDTLRIECNQLIDLKARFKDADFTGDIEFTVDIDTTWDGSNDGGGGDVTISKAEHPQP